MNTSPVCSKCGAELPDDAPSGLCPQCLFGTALEPGSKVQYFGNYELLEELAFGGMGIVFKARQMSLNRLVALKMIRGGILASPEDVRRFRAEAEAAANLQHPNIVAIHEVGEHEGEQYYSMDLVQGRNLAELCASEPLAPERAARYLRAIAEAVHFAHQRGTLHRDLKPQNLMFRADGSLAVLDFGIAKHVDAIDRTGHGEILGTPRYMSPEQVRGSALDLRTDIYSAGVLLFQMLTGTHLFDGETAAEVALHYLNTQPPDLPEHLSKYQRLMDKLLEKDRDARFRNADEVIGFLSRKFYQGTGAFGAEKTAKLL